jgi:hypothetical protein
MESTILSPGKGGGGTSGNATLEKEKMWKGKKERKDERSERKNIRKLERKKKHERKVKWKGKFRTGG